MPNIKRWLVLAPIVVASACFWPPPQQTWYEMPVQYIRQTTAYYCVPATILMWHKYLFPQGTITQNNIWDWAASHFPGSTHVGLGIDTDVIEEVGETFLGRPLSEDWYVGGEQVRRAIADQARGMELNRPTIVVLQNGAHAVLFIGATWHRLNDALQRPDFEYIKMHDPDNEHGNPNQVYSVGQWQTTIRMTLGGPCSPFCALNIQEAGQRNSGLQSLQAFDEEGGVYTGPSPANPSGRYRFDGNGSCYWEANEDGDSACEPSGGGPLQVSLQTYVTGEFVVAEDNGGGDVNANRGAAGPWETFTLTDVNGGALMDGDEGNLMTGSGWYLQAQNCGGGAFRAEGGAPYSWETFRIRVQTGGPQVDDGDWIALETWCGYYVVAEEGGGGIVNADRTGIGAWENFRLVVH